MDICGRTSWTRSFEANEDGDVSPRFECLGAINPAKEICERAHRAGAVVLVDAAQSVPHFSLDVCEIGCDFLTLSGHKMCGPMGIGACGAPRASRRDATVSGGKQYGCMK